MPLPLRGPVDVPPTRPLFSRQRRCAFFGLLLALLLGSVLPLRAFPPAPFYTLYGDVRDQYGNLIPAGSATVVLSQGTKEILRTPLTGANGANYSYQIRMRIDMLRPSTATYSSLALNAGSVFTLAVDIGGQLFYPIEMAHPPTVGNPSDRHRLDLTLGVDSDGDGLPDAWEEAQLYEAGYRPGPNGFDLSLIDRNGDFDHDGISNWAEYIAGTYAADASMTLQLKIAQVLSSSVRLEFYAIYGKSYTLESSTDLKTWRALSFYAAEPTQTAIAQPSLVSTTTGVTSIFVGSSSGTVFYRLTVR